MSITKAYCVEKRAVIDIYEAREYYFAHNNEQRLNFLCPDDDCRETSKAKIIGVNYWKSLPDGDELVVRQHFRINSNTPHADNCPVFEYDEAEKIVRDEISLQSKRRNSKISDKIDVFCPVTADNNAEISDDPALTKIRFIQTKQERLDAYKKYSRTAKTRSSMLHEIVNCYLIMKDNNELNNSLTIGKDTRTYADFFCHLSNYSYEQQNDSIIHGGAKVARYPKDASQIIRGYKINFYDPIKISNTDYRLSLYLPLSKISKYKYGKSLRKHLETVMDDSSLYIICYFWGNIVNSPYEGTMNVEVSHLNNMYLYPKPKINKR